MLELRSLAYTFPGNKVQALEGVDLSLEPGKVHAILGENGAGKSTLARICTGHLAGWQGELRLEGRAVPPGGPRAALARGLALVPQHPRLAGELKLVDNLLLGLDPGAAGRARRASLPAQRQALARQLAAWGIDLPLDLPASALDAAHCHWAALAEALLTNPRYLFLDEPSAPYSPDEVERLYRLLREAAGRGLMVAVITHRLQEVLDWCDTAHVLRRGRLVAQLAVDRQTGVDELLRPMFGPPDQPAAEAPPALPPRAAAQPPASGLLIDCRYCHDGPGRELIDFCLEAPPGRITGVLGLKDQGLELLEDLLSGLARGHGVRLEFRSRPLWRQERLRIAYIAGKRFTRGIAVGGSIADNLLVRARCLAFRRGWAGPRRRLAWLARHGFAAPRHWDDAITTLSGGMIQRLIFERELSKPHPELVICAEPWWGLDHHFQQELLSRLRALAERGATVLVLSAELDEAMALSDSLAVVRDGRIVLRQERSAFQRAELAQAMVHGPRGDQA